jgi:outer membrane protein OmpA-like peptidoglycan-associated protein
MIILLANAVNASAANKPDTLQVFFPTSVSDIAHTQQSHLDSLLYSGRIKSSDSIRLIGYADEPGSAGLNNRLAGQRAASVKKYLLSSGIDAAHISECTSKGNAVRSGEDYFQRRVDIVLNPQNAQASSNPEAQKSNNSIFDFSKIKVGDVIILEQLQFHVSTSEFQQESLPLLETLAVFLNDHPSIQIKIEGHICCGSDPKAFNRNDSWYSLSVSRAKAVYDYLVKHNIAAGRMSYEGYGFSRPRVYPEKTEEDRFKNRRVELRVMKI